MPLKIIVADQEPKSAQLMRALATPLGHVVLPFQDYDAAVQKAETYPFDVAFVGVRPPDNGGLGLARRMRELHPNRRTAIVMLTAAGDVEVHRKAFGEGFDLILDEPLQKDQLRGILLALDGSGWKRMAMRLPLRTEVSCVAGDTRHTVLSLNISASGMLLQPVADAAIGTVLSLEFQIAEVHAAIAVQGKVVRVDGSGGLGVEFLNLAREQENAIRVYVLGSAKESVAVGGSPDYRTRRLFVD